MAWQIGVPVIALLAGVLFRHWRRLGFDPWKAGTLTLLRTSVLLGIILLLARPVWVERFESPDKPRPVAILLDKSESMSLEEGGQARYTKAVGFLRDQLIPALKKAGLKSRVGLFDGELDTEHKGRIAETKPIGKRTDLGRAVADMVAHDETPPSAVIALTDGVATETGHNRRAIAALADNRVAFVGIGFGSDTGTHTLSLRNVESPPVVVSKTQFQISAHVEAQNLPAATALELVLFREGKALFRKTVTPGAGSHSLIENFSVKEAEPGRVKFTVQLLPPDLPGLKTVSTRAETSVTVSDDKGLRVLFVQGALTWDYKFLRLALEGDSGIKLTGLTRTSEKSVFRQNVETADELLTGFPTKIEELAPFRVVVLSELRPADLSRSQQDLLAKYCGELGGGVMIMGGRETFDSSWKGSRLEKLLPVSFGFQQSAATVVQPFRIELTPDALNHNAFQLADGKPTAEPWSKLPAFKQYGQAEAAKPGARVWIVHARDKSPSGKHPLLASQRYGAGISAALCLQNLWRWRMAKGSEPGDFDRFWRQWLRFLAESTRQEVMIHFADQDLRPGSTVRVTLERHVSGSAEIKARPSSYYVRLLGEARTVLETQQVKLVPGRPIDVQFKIANAGLYDISVTDENKVPVADRPLEIRDLNREFQHTARDMQMLEQWAAVTGGLSAKVEECPEAGEVIRRVIEQVQQRRLREPLRKPAGINGWILALLVGALSAEWILRKRWNLT